jgi:polysaccharide export outer membrane protein
MRNRIVFLQLLLLVSATAMLFAQTAPFSEREPRYRLQPLDTLEVRYRYSPEFDQTATVQPDGFVSLPLLGDLKLLGLTLDQAKAAIVEKASQRLRDPEITVVLKEFEKPYFIVGGEVTTPGRFEMRGSVNALQAISMAGGFKSLSAKHSQVILYRKVGPDMARAEIIDLKSAVNVSSSASSEPLPKLQSGDMLVVPQNRISKIERLVRLANIGMGIPF